MSAAATESTVDTDVQQLGEKLDQARTLFERQSSRITDLECEADEAGLVRDKALYWLLRFCEKAEQEHWGVRDAEVREIHEAATQLLFENNIYPGLPEPDNAILRLMEIVTRDQEGHEHDVRQV